MGTQTNIFSKNVIITIPRLFLGRHGVGVGSLFIPVPSHGTGTFGSDQRKDSSQSLLGELITFIVSLTGA